MKYLSLHWVWSCHAFTMFNSGEFSNNQCLPGQEPPADDREELSHNATALTVNECNREN